LDVSVFKPDPPPAGGFVARGGDAFEQHSTPMRVLALDPAGGTRARCAGTDGIPVTVEAALIRPIELGAIVLVQGGLALTRLDTEWVPP
jgi:hydrogenase maturation factor